MEANHQALCLNMIVNNEAPVIARCLASVRPIIDYWVIVDTGSTDGTQDAIRTFMADLPGELHERPWRDFAHNRTEALELAQPHGEYVLIIDADGVLEIEPQFKVPALQADSYMLRIAEGYTVSHNGTQIVRAALPWRWRGVLHEFLTCDDARSSVLLEGLRLRRNHDGARHRDPQTYKRDAEILYAALQTESDPFMQARYQFYLAQSYRDCDEKEKALQAYLKRAELGFWIEEVFVSLYSAAKLLEALGRPFDEVMAAYLRAADAVPSRAAEALHGASRYCRLSKRYKEGYEIARRAVANGASSSGEAPDGLFVETWIYEYGFLDEFAVNAYWAGAYQDCLDACERILRERKCPEAERPRIEANAAFPRQQLGIGMPRTYDFSEDVFSEHIPLFEQFLSDLKDRPCRLLEIGTYEGRSAIWLNDNIATHPSSRLETVDAYEWPRLRHNLAISGSGKITFHLGPSVVVMRTLALDAYDFVYIDGCHFSVNVLEDAVHAFRLVKVGGVVGFDDYLWDEPWNQDGPPKPAIDAFLTIYSKEIELLHKGWQVWIRKKK